MRSSLKTIFLDVYIASSFLLFCFLRQGSPEWPGTHCVDKTGLIRASPSSAASPSAGTEGVHPHIGSLLASFY